MEVEVQKLVDKLLETDKKVKLSVEKDKELTLYIEKKQEEIKNLQAIVKQTEEVIQELEKKKENINEEIKDREKNVADHESFQKKLTETAKRTIQEIEEEVILNIGGKLFYTTKFTLTSQENMFFGLFSSGNFKPNKRGEYFIDRNPEYFHIILDYLRGIDIGPLIEYHLAKDKIAMNAFVIEFDYYSIQIREIDYEMQKKIRQVSAELFERHEKKCKELEKRIAEEKRQQEMKNAAEKVRKGELKENFVDCSLLTNAEQDQIIIWTQILKQRKLLYRGTRDGFRAGDFHRLCNRKGPTITVVMSTNGFIFGGYSAVEWVGSNQWKFDQKCFLFSVMNANGNKMIKMDNDGPQHSNQYSIYDHASYGPTFGGGHDLHICDQCNASISSCSKLGHSYSLGGYTHGTTEIQSILAGSLNFQVAEIEVFGE